MLARSLVVLVLAASCAAAASPEALSDGQIAGIAQNANQSDLEVAAAAAERGSSLDLTIFAGEVLARRRELGERLNVLLAESGLVALHAEESYDVLGEGRRTAAALEQMPSDDVDLNFLDYLIGSDQRTLELLDARLIPRASDPRLAEFLRELRGALAEERRRAQALRPLLER